MLKNSKCRLFLSCLEFAILNSLYSEFILKPKQVICLENVFFEFGYSCCIADRLWKNVDLLLASCSFVYQKERDEIYSYLVENYCCFTVKCSALDVMSIKEVADDGEPEVVCDFNYSDK